MGCQTKMIGWTTSNQLFPTYHDWSTTNSMWCLGSVQEWVTCYVTNKTWSSCEGSAGNNLVVDPNYLGSLQTPYSRKDPYLKLLLKRHKLIQCPLPLSPSHSSLAMAKWPITQYHPTMLVANCSSPARVGCVGGHYGVNIDPSYMEVSKVKFVIL